MAQASELCGNSQIFVGHGFKAVLLGRHYQRGFSRWPVRNRDGTKALQPVGFGLARPAERPQTEVYAARSPPIRSALQVAKNVDQFGTRTTVSDLTISTHRAGRFSCGATRRNGPSAPGMGAPSIVSATMISESMKLELNSSKAKTTR